ncbi:TlpA family protein disulfide reductase [Microbacterium saccharophilum]|uniref:TlpA family protein disulfide reductase n=1 Tax=Microbacterium saccharophilum TaxID=1213358 RepID=A0A5C8HZZ3_9MICO|nr:TlpA disulfide reductase family protein [Microbacterium saccharophilum]TXK11298.1 TlpA family protein disulfide reductase [Microbacterium saccharophilum]GEP48588.1 thiol-disulfide isomerase [Microbacterium saccharophilum]
MRRLAATVVALALTASLAACTSPNDRLTDLYESGSNQGFISGDGSFEEIPLAERGEPVVFDGEAVDGSAVSSADYLGEVLVLNFWYAGCGPCRAEAPLLEEVYGAVSGDGAEFLGINIYDGPEQATSFENTYGITYPSLLARGDADLKLALQSVAPIQAAPTTLVLDKQGRVAARFIGQLASASILKTLVADAVAEEL